MSHPPKEVVPVESKPWQTGLAPVYIGLFLWIAFFDQIGRRTLPAAGLGWSLLGALAAGPLGYLLLFRVPAMWGQQTGRPLAVVSTSTFGNSGARLVPGLLSGIAQVVWFAVATGYAVELTFQGLALGQFLDPRVLRPTQVGGMTLQSPLFLATALFWCITVGLVGGWFVRWIAALMQVFPIFPAVLLSAVMLAMLGGLGTYRPIGFDGLTGEAVAGTEAGLRAFLLVIQAIFAFTAMAGVTAADWGSASLGPRDVRMGGWFGVGLAPVLIATLGLLSVAGYRGGLSERPIAAVPAPGQGDSHLEEQTAQGLAMARPSEAPLAVPPYTFREVLAGGFDRRLACLMLLIFGLASLAPACYAAFDFGHRFKAIAPGLSRLSWTIIGASAAWFLIVGGWYDRIDAVFGALGAAFAPVAGAMAADYRRHGGNWPGPRRGINPPGLIAWGLGLAVGLLPLIGRGIGHAPLARFQPASVWAFVVAFLAYEILAGLGLESGRDLTRKTDPEKGIAEAT
ncbi:purine-cytosine permease-like transporter [Tundrisphaera sp. TA3]|uniref:purine-cytosine permease-like transporter n=1 Tax=Tundrisphaera sp. TA3 TaxID=3435775 RepID=UPI003EBD3A56